MRQKHIGSPRKGGAVEAEKPPFHHVIVERNLERELGDNVDNYIDMGYEIVNNGKRRVELRIPTEQFEAREKAQQDEANARLGITTDEESGLQSSVSGRYVDPAAYAQEFKDRSLDLAE